MVLEVGRMSGSFALHTLSSEDRIGIRRIVSVVLDCHVCDLPFCQISFTLFVATNRLYFPQSSAKDTRNTRF